MRFIRVAAKRQKPKPNQTLIRRREREREREQKEDNSRKSFLCKKQILSEHHIWKEKGGKKKEKNIKVERH